MQMEDGTYYLCFMASAESGFFCTNVWISDTASESEVYNALRPFMDSRGVYSEYTVTRTLTDWNGNPTVNEDIMD